MIWTVSLTNSRPGDARYARPFGSPKARFCGSPVKFFVVVSIAHIIFNKVFFYLNMPWDIYFIVNKNGRDIVVIKNDNAFIF